MTSKAKQGSKRKKQKAGLNKSILSVGFGALNNMLTYKIEEKGGLVLILPTKKIKPSQRCPQCGKIHKDWANLANRYHICNDCGFVRVDGWYYPPHLSVRSGRASFPAPSSRQSRVFHPCSYEYNRGKTRVQLTDY